MLRHGELSHGGTSSEGRAFECAQGQSGPNYDIKYDAINLQAPDERMVTVDDATIGPSSNGSMAQHYDTKYNTITLDTPDERKVLVNEATIGLGVGGSEIMYDTLTLDTPAENEVLVNEATIGHGSDSSSGDGLCSGSPKARARAGMRRRKMANRSTTQKLRDEAVNLCHVMIACTLMVGSWAKELTWKAHFGKHGRCCSPDTTRAVVRLAQIVWRSLRARPGFLALMPVIDEQCYNQGTCATTMTCAANKIKMKWWRK